MELKRIALAVGTSVACALALNSDAAAQGGELQCEMCIEYWQTIGYTQEGVPIKILKHRFELGLGQCEGGNNLIRTQPSAGKDEAKLVDEELEEITAYCAGCGDESRCHPGLEAGNCHTPCGSGGGGNLAAERAKIETDLASGDWSVLAARLSSSRVAKYHAPSRSVQLMSRCNPDLVVSTVPLDAISVRRLESAIRTRRHTEPA